MSRYTIEKYCKCKNAGVISIEQHAFAEYINERKIIIGDISFYPTNDFIVINFSHVQNPYIKPRTLGHSMDRPSSNMVEYHQPQIWFLHFLYKYNLTARDGIVFYVKNSHDVRERYTYMGINDELRAFLMTLMLAGSEHET